MYFLVFFLSLVSSLFINTTISNARIALQGSDIAFIGAFAMPRVTPNINTTWGRGLALRRVNGEIRLFSSGFATNPDRYPMYEVSIPTLKTSKPWNVASVVREWGLVFEDAWGQLNGLYWDETDKRLYYSSSAVYVASGDPYRPTISFLKFSEDELTVLSYGRWGLENRSLKQVNFGITAIPNDFATEYLGGKRLAAGFGGIQSAASIGPVSFGPSLAAFSPPVAGTESETSYLPTVPLVGYGGSDPVWSSGNRPPVDRCWRDDDVIHDAYGNISDPDSSTATFSPRWHISGDETFYWQGYSINGSSRVGIPDNITFPDNAIVTKHWVPGNAFWNTDYLEQAGTWIQTTNKEGIVFLGSFAIGHAWYYQSDTHSLGSNYKWLIYTREQMASVAQGTTREDQIQPTRYPATFTQFGVPENYEYTGTPRYICTGMVFDPVDSRLYVALRFTSNAPTFNSESAHTVFVFNINDNLNKNHGSPKSMMSRPPS